MNNKDGFTLIELITAIVIISIISVMAGIGLAQLARGYYLAKTSTVGTDQAQIALTRLGKELSALRGITSASATVITYVSTRDGASHTLAWGGADQPLTLDGDTLLGGVQSFSMTYYTYNYASRAFTAGSYSSAAAIIEITLQLKGYEDIPLIFVKRVCI